LSGANVPHTVVQQPALARGGTKPSRSRFPIWRTQEGSMSKRTKAVGSPRPDGKARRLFQLMHQRRLQEAQRRNSPLHREGDDLPDKQQQTQHNIVSEGLPFGLFTSDQ
jgi:hypothetical protein